MAGRKRRDTHRLIRWLWTSRRFDAGSNARRARRALLPASGLWRGVMELRALAQGANVLVLDDAFQRLDVHRDLNIA
ncbi:MAG: hypothetical protein E4H37_03115, partial [Gemmatimonadales bacterium]